MGGTEILWGDCISKRGRQEWVKGKRDGNTEITEGRTQRAQRQEKKEKREAREEKGKREERLRR
jgi:hypothetical protein